jgi:hypothetical protein
MFLADCSNRRAAEVTCSSSIVGSATVSQRMPPLPCQQSAFILHCCSLVVDGLATGRGGDPLLNCTVLVPTAGQLKAAVLPVLPAQEAPAEGCGTFSHPARC